MGGRGMGVPDACQYKIAGGRYHMVTRKESDSIGTQAAFVLVVPVSAAGVGPPGMGFRHNGCLDADVADGASCHHDSHAHCNDFPADVSHKHFPLDM